MESTTTPKLHNQTQDEKPETVMGIGGEPVMESALEVLTALNKTNQMVLKARGSSIPNAVAVANIITEKMLVGTSKIGKITLDTVNEAGIGNMTSTIEIIVLKI